MNKALLIFLLLGVLMFSRCNPKGGDSPPEEYVLTEADLVGTWTVDRFSSEYLISGIFLGENVSERGTTKIGNSDLQLRLDADGSWVSSGEYSLTVASESEQEVTRQEGIGTGSWSFRSDTLYLGGLENYGGTGTFAPVQACAVADFVQFISIDFTTRVDETDTNPDRDISLRTESDWKINLVR